ncbi:MAG TPA: hypothetical protein VF484_00705 [Candidatus Limnocylindrales bacterium]
MDRRKIAALLAAGILTLGVAGTALAGSGPSDPQGITPVEHPGNIQLPGDNSDHDKANCDIGDAVDIDGQGGDSDFTDDATTTNGVTVTIEYDATAKTLSFTAEGGVVTIAYVKGGDAYNEYDYPVAGVTTDGNLYAPDNDGGQPAGLSHVIFCTGEAAPSDQPTEQPTEQPSSGGGGETNVPTQPATDAVTNSGSSGPSEMGWLLVVTLGVIVASVFVLKPTRVIGRR